MIKRVVNELKFIGIEGIRKGVFIFNWFWERRREDRINSDSYDIFEKSRNDFGKKATVNCDTWIGIGLNEKGIKLVIEHVIESKELEAELFPGGVQLNPNRRDEISRYFLHFDNRICKIEFWIAVI